MEQQQQPQSRRSRKVEEEQEQSQPECPLPSPKTEDDLPPGTHRKALPDGGWMIIKDNFTY
jgi:hypothetical protein